MAQIGTLIYRRYRLIALVVYGAVLFAGFTDWLYGGIGPQSVIGAPENVRFTIFVVTVLALIGLELKGLGQASFADVNRVDVISFVVRVLLFVGACSITDLNYSKILFLPVLLYSYLAVNKRLSYFLALLGVAMLFGYNATQPEFMRPPPSPPLISLGSQILPSEQRVRPPKAPPTGAAFGGKLVDWSMGSLITLLFTLLLARAMSQSIEAQQKLTGLLSSLEASHAQLKQYSSRVADLAATEERNRLARDIHDSLGHHLAAINIQLEKANAYRERDPNRAYEAVQHAQDTVQDALKDVRESVSSLRQEGARFSFQQSLNELVRRVDHSELTIGLKQTGDSSRYSRLKLMTLYRVMQEGLTNVHKHAQASQVAIAIQFGPHRAKVELSDNGSGFDVADWKAQAHKQTTQGLVGLQERLSLVGGTLSVQSNGSGTTLRVSLPQAIALENTPEAVV